MQEQTNSYRASLITSLKQTFLSLGVRNYRLFAFGQGVSLCGTWAQTVAMAWLVLQLTHSGTQLGLVVAAQFLPVLLFGVWGGVIADRFNKRRVLYFTQSIAALLALALGLLVINHLIQLWMIYALAAGLGLTQAIDSPSRQSFVIEMVGKEKIKNAVTLNAILVNIGRIIGPTLAGVLIVAVGIGPCFIVNAFSFIALLIALLLMDASELQPTTPASKEPGQIRAGLRYAWQVPEIRAILIMMLIVGTLAYEFPVVLPLLATRTFHGGASTYASLTAFMSLGALIGGLYTASRDDTSAKTILKVTLLFGLSIMALSIMPGVVTALALLIVVGVFSMLFIAMTNSSLQLTSSPEMRGRVMSLLAITFLGTTPIGGPIIGYISDHTSPRIGLLVGGVATVIAAIIGMSIMKTTPNVPVVDPAKLAKI